jgi:hypothetical protein
MPSTVVDTMIYDPTSKTLRVRFVSGSIYEYLNVPPEIYESMRTAGSKGIYLNQHIKDHFEFRKIK